MIQYYLVLFKSKGNLAKLLTDQMPHLVYLFVNTIPEVDITKTSDFEFEQMSFDFPVIYDLDIFESSNKSDGFTIKSIKLSNIRQFELIR